MTQRPLAPGEAPDSGAQIARLRAFLRWLAPPVFFFGTLETAVSIPSGDVPSGATGAVILAFGLVVIWAWRALDRGELGRAVNAIWMGIIAAAVVITIIQPIVYAALVVIPLLAVAVALPFRRGAELRRVLLVAWAAITVIVAAGVLLPSSSTLPDWFLEAFRISATMTTSGLVLLLLGQFSDRLIGALALSENVNTALRSAQAELREEREQLEIILRSIGDGVVATDRDGSIVFLNQVAEVLTGWPAAEANGRPFGEVFDARSPHDRSRADDLVDTVVRTEAAATTPHGLLLVARDGVEHSIAGGAAPIHDPDGRTVGVVVVVHDITRDLEAEAERRRIERRIRETQKLESLGLLAGGIAHDFNNLLVSILGNASLALGDLSPESPVRTNVEEIETASRRAADLARQMLAYSGRGRFDVQRLDVNGLVGEVTQLMRASIPKGASLRLDLRPDVAAVEGDATQLRQVVMNLVVNAGEAIGDGDGQIVVRTASVVLDRLYLSATVLDDELPPGPYVVIDVSDTGSGMDEATQARIFDPFFSTKFTGRGLGLAAVLGIVRGHRGAIQVYSEPGTGSRFRVLLPAVEQGELPPRAPIGERWHATGTVLVVDDEPGVRAVAAAMLRRAGLEVLLAADGAEALELYQARGESIDAVLLDLTMPRMGGAEAFDRIRGVRPDARVILMSGYAEEEASARVVGGGLAGFLQKPFTAEELAEAMTRALA